MAKDSFYNKVDSSLQFCEREKETLEFWKQNDIAKNALKQRENRPLFVLYDGPPTANGKPHIGHILTRVMKDIIPRYKYMKGYNVLRKAGWDTHGLPVELEVEKLLGMDGKQDIEKYGIEAFIKKCKESVWKYKGEWEKITDRVAYWVDMEHPYITYDNNYIESVWWSLKQIFDKGLIYKGHKVVPYCPRCGTALSSHEVAQGYKNVKEKSVYVKFELKGENNTYFLAWTTTPWTLPSNVALCVNAKEDYQKIKVGDEYYILAENLVSKHFEEFEVIENYKGIELEKTQYIPLFSYAKFEQDAYYITCDDYVTLTDGTGIVHIAPAFGEDDSKVGKKYDLPFVQMVNERGIFSENATDFAGKFAKDADKFIIQNLESRGLLLKDEMYEHTYPFCWRCDTPLLYYARSSYFIQTTKMKDNLLKANNSVNWMPENIKAGRMGNFLENVIDWGVSRERYWGTPLPIWICDKCKKTHCIGSLEELKKLSKLKDDVELHRPYIDEVTFDCDCGGKYHRTPEVIDCWYDSGAMPFAQLHYPFENKELFEKAFPANFISEAVDQTRGWFYTLLAISTILFDKSPFENCLVLGHVNDEKGLKMSKHKGNVVDCWSILDKNGADAVRWYFYTASAPWLPNRFYGKAVDESQRKFMGTLWNTYAFFVLYAEIDKYNPNDFELEKCKLSLMDKWLLSKLNSLVEFVDKSLNGYNILDAARTINEFVDNLSNWYVRRCRERFWGKDMTEDKAAAYTTLYTTLVTLTKLIAPFVPFISENIYQNLVRNFDKTAPISVHFCDFPEVLENYIDKDIEKQMDIVIDIVVIARSCRNAASIKNRQPLANLYVKTPSAVSLQSDYLSIISEELNIKNTTFVNDVTEYVGYEIKPQLRTLGKKYGSLINAIREYLSTCDSLAVVNAVNSGKIFTTEIGEVVVEFALEDLLIAPKNKVGYFASSDKGITAVLDCNLTDELILEGIQRELVSKIQTMRKDAGFEVVDHIAIEYTATDRCATVLQSQSKEIMQDVLCDRISQGENGSYKKVWDINGEQVKICISKC